jgi:2-phospho-L-lactate transferase/gluconeogenesis factor (CofD/UPF0052 family)
VIPHLMLPELRDAIVASPARKIVTLNLEPQAGETEGFSPETHLQVLGEHAPTLLFDVVLADRGSVVDEPQLRESVDDLGARLVVADLAADGEVARHDPEMLADAYAGIMRQA